MDEFWKIAAGVLGGGLFTALCYVFAWSNKITSIATIQKMMKDTLDTHVAAPPQTCNTHSKTLEVLNTVKTNQESVLNRLDKVEAKVDCLDKEMAGVIALARK